MALFKLKIVTPYGIYKETEVEILNIVSSSGEMGILANHLPLTSAIKIGPMNYVDKNKERHFFSQSGGFIYVGNDETTLIINSIESKEDIDLVRANEAKKRAEKLLESNEDWVDKKRAKLALDKANTRIRVKETK